jgi:hypothetical protein
MQKLGKEHENEGDGSTHKLRKEHEKVGHDNRFRVEAWN